MKKLHQKDFIKTIKVESDISYKIVTLKKLIKFLFKKYGLKKNTHFNVWICGYYENEEADIIDSDNPFYCCHFNKFKRSKDGTDIFQWLEFDVEDYKFEANSEYRLYVKLCSIYKSPL